jgi:hypothetical protein
VGWTILTLLVVDRYLQNLDRRDAHTMVGAIAHEQ